MGGCGFFVAMEWLPVAEERSYAGKGYGAISSSNGQVLGATNEFGMEGITWSKNFLRPWSVSVIPIESINRINAKIGAELKVYRKKHMEDD